MRKFINIIKEAHFGGFEHENDFECYKNGRGWSVIKPLNDDAMAYALQNFPHDALEWAEEFGHGDTEWWFEARDVMDYVEGFIADGYTVANMENMEKNRLGD